MTSVSPLCTTSMKIIEKIKHHRSTFFQRNNSSVNKSEIKYDDNEEDDDDKILSFFMGYLTNEMVDEAKNKLHETEEVKQECLKKMRKLIENEKNLVCRTDDLFILQFLRARKYDVKKAFKLLQNYFEFRKDYSYIYDENFDFKIIKQVIMKSYMGYLKKRDRMGSVIFIAKLGHWDPDVDSFEDIFRTVSGMLVYAAEDPATQVIGFRIIIDCRGLSLKQMKVCTPKNLLLLIRSTQFCFPARYRGIHIFSANKLFDIVWTMLYPFLTSKLKARITNHGQDVTALQEFIHPSVLPTEYGGTLGPFDNSSWEEIIETDKGEILDMLTYGYK